MQSTPLAPRVIRCRTDVVALARKGVDFCSCFFFFLGGGGGVFVFSVCFLFFFVLCVCVSHSVPKRPLTILAGGSSPLMSLLPTKLLTSWEDITADHRDVPANHVILSSLLHPWAEAVSRSFSGRSCLFKSTCYWPFGLQLPDMTEFLLLTITWTPQSIIQVCFRRSISESHPMARLPVWSLQVRAASMTQQLRISYPLRFLAFLLALLFFFPLRTCLVSFLFEASRRLETYSVGRLLLYEQLEIPVCSESALHSNTRPVVYSLRLQLSFATYAIQGHVCVCVTLCSEETTYDTSRGQ